MQLDEFHLQLLCLLDRIDFAECIEEVDVLVAQRFDIAKKIGFEIVFEGAVSKSVH